MLYATLASTFSVAAQAQEEGRQVAETVAATAPRAPAPPAEVVFDLFGRLPITNSILTAWLVMAVLLLFAFASSRNLKMVPTGLQNFAELIIETWMNLLDQMMGRKGRRFLPLILTFFLFILFSNWIGILPIVGSITIVDPAHEAVPLFRSANSDLNMTAAMALIVMLTAEFFELRSLGPGGYLKGLLLPNPTRWLEIVTRPLSLALRLFGNIFAGEVLVATMLGVAPYAVFAFLGLEVFVGFIQALIFAMLTLVFLTIATMHEHSDESHGDQASGHAPVAAPGGEAHQAARASSH
ncbi:MAG: F0F1 ATP synthase subunit A [Chloroflexi bacterium]|nr:F0F1 ATP synthase subunit A [Chloroflexota bacterium]